jgi:hypothetical protein
MVMDRAVVVLSAPIKDNQQHPAKNPTKAFWTFEEGTRDLIVSFPTVMVAAGSLLCCKVPTFFLSFALLALFCLFRIGVVFHRKNWIFSVYVVDVRRNHA